MVKDLGSKAGHYMCECCLKIHHYWEDADECCNQEEQN